MGEKSTSTPLILKIKMPAGEVEVKDRTARLIAFFAEHQAFFNDTKVTGNVVLSFKDESMVIKNEVAAQF